MKRLLIVLWMLLPALAFGQTPPSPFTLTTITDSAAGTNRLQFSPGTISAVGSGYSITIPGLLTYAQVAQGGVNNPSGTLTISVYFGTPIPAGSIVTVQPTWTGACSSSVPITSVGCQPPAAAVSSTDFVLGWRPGQTPSTRAMEVSQIIAGNLPGAFSTLAATGATTLGSTLGVTGAATLSSTLGVTGAATLSSTLGVTGNTTLGGTLGVTGAATLSSTLGVSGLATLSAGASVSGAPVSIAPINTAGVTTSAGLNFTGNPVWSGTGEIARIYENDTWTGSTASTNPVALHGYFASNDQVTATGTAPVFGLFDSVQIGSPSAKGAVSSISGNVSLTSASGNSTGVGATYIGGQFYASILANDNGTLGNPRGQITAINGLAQWSAAATYSNGGSAAELDILAASGAQLMDRFGLLIDRAHLDAAQASRDDCGICVDATDSPAGAGTGFLRGLGFGRSGAHNPLDPVNGVAISFMENGGSGAIAAKGGIDFTNLAPTTFYILGSTFKLDPSGNWTMVSVGNGSTALQVTGAGSWTANGSTALSLTNLGPTGAHSTVQEWLTFKDAAGTTRYVPAF